MSILLPILVRRGRINAADSTVRRRIATGELVTVLPGVHLRSDFAHDPFWLAAAATVWRPDATILGDMAAALTFWPERQVGRVEVACRTAVRRPGYSFTRRHLPADLVTWAGSCRISRPALTALDLCLATDGESIDTVLRAKMARIDDLWTALAATAYRRGNGERRKLLVQSRAEPWSVAERLAHKLLHEARITEWRANVPLRLKGQKYYLDIVFDGLKFVVEIDGRAFHTASDVFEADRIRQNALVLSGWTVLRFTYKRLVDEPEQVVAEIRAGKALASRRLAESGWQLTW